MKRGLSYLAYSGEMKIEVTNLGEASDGFFLRGREQFTPRVPTLVAESWISEIRGGEPTRQK